METPQFMETTHLWFMETPIGDSYVKVDQQLAPRLAAFNGPRFQDWVDSVRSPFAPVLVPCFGQTKDGAVSMSGAERWVMDGDGW